MSDSETVFFNGRFIPLADARVSPLDRGFLFGDGVYEVIPFYRRRGFYLGAHLRRLRQSLAAAGIEKPMDDARWRAAIGELLERRALADAAVYLQVTRGVAPRRHLPPAGIAPTVFMMANPLAPPSAAAVANGVCAASAADFRWTRADIKSTSLLGAVMLAAAANARGADEPLLLRDDFLSEGSSANFMLGKDGGLIAPPMDENILGGVTCRIIFEIAARLGVGVQIRPVRRAEVFAADELLLTSSTREILAVVRVDDAAIGDGRPGRLFRRLHSAFQDLKKEAPDDFAA